ncbi:MAG TPA: hypothetical protein VF584_18725 [Longimicrobium sp.]
MPSRSAQPPRDLRFARLPLLLAYLLVLLGTPIGEAGFLWMHLTTAHSSPAKPHAELERPAGLRLRADGTLASTPEHEHEPPPAQEHEHAAPPKHEPAGAREHQRAGSGEHGHAHADESEHADAAEHTRAAEREHAHVISEHANPSEHHARIASSETEPAPRSVAPDQLHEHGGRMHTHRQHRAPDAELLIDALSKFYLAPPPKSAPSTNADARHARQIPPTPHQVAARIDTPPPRPPG